MCGIAGYSAMTRAGALDRLIQDERAGRRTTQGRYGSC